MAVKHFYFFFFFIVFSELDAFSLSELRVPCYHKSPSTRYDSFILNINFFWSEPSLTLIYCHSIHHLNRWCCVMMSVLWGIYSLNYRTTLQVSVCPVFLDKNNPVSTVQNCIAALFNLCVFNFFLKFPFLPLLLFPAIFFLPLHCGDCHSRRCPNFPQLVKIDCRCSCTSVQYIHYLSCPMWFDFLMLATEDLSFCEFVLKTFPKPCSVIANVCPLVKICSCMDSLFWAYFSPFLSFNAVS